MPEATGEEKQLVVFRLGSEEYGVDISSVREVIKLSDVTTVPGAADVEGVINLRGHIIPVMDLKKRFGLPESEYGSESRIIVLTANDHLVGVKVDAATEVLRIADDAIEPAPEIAHLGIGEFVRGVGKLENRLVILVDLTRLFSEGEPESEAGEGQS